MLSLLSYIRSYQLIYWTKNFYSESCTRQLSKNGKNLNLNQKDLANKSALYYAINSSQPSLALSLLKHGSRPDLTYTSPSDKNLIENIFHMSCRESKQLIVEYLIERSPELILVPNSLGQTPFDISLSLRHHSEIISFLNYFKTNPSQIEKLSPQSIDLLGKYFVKQKDFDWAKDIFLFLEEFVWPLSPTNTLLVELSQDFDSLFVQPHLFPGQDLNSDILEKAYITAGHWTEGNIKNFNKKIELICNSKFIDIDAQNSSGQTALMNFIGQNIWSMVNFLLDLGANTLTKDNNGETALSLCLNIAKKDDETINKIEEELLEKLKIITERQALSHQINTLARPSNRASTMSHKI